MLLKGLPEEFKPFLIYANTSGEDMSISRFKVSLKLFEETEELAQKEEKFPGTGSSVEPGIKPTNKQQETYLMSVEKLIIL